MASNAMWTTKLFIVSSIVIYGSIACPFDCQCSNDHEVICSSVGLTRFPRDIPRGTKYLQVDGNTFNVIHAGDFSSLQDLVTLTLANCQISEIEDGAFASLGNLETLNLALNDLREIGPETLRGLQNLQRLRIDQNPVRMKPCTFAAIPRIQDINADFTRLVFNESLFLSTSICESNSSYSEDIFEDAANLVILNRLLHLRLERTQASGINHRVMSLVPNVEHVNLQSCLIQNIANKTFKSNRRLFSLSLNGNVIRSVNQGTFAGLKRLQVLLLGNNHGLQIHPNAFHSTPKLKTLYLNNLGLEELSLNFSLFQQLTNLNLDGNRLRQIPPGSLSGAGSIRVCLGNNPWRCDCNMIWLHEWLLQFSLGGLYACLDPVCANPPSLTGYPVQALTRDAFQCINETITQPPSGTPSTASQSDSSDLTYIPQSQPPEAVSQSFVDITRVPFGSRKNKSEETSTKTVLAPSPASRTTTPVPLTDPSMQQVTTVYNPLFTSNKVIKNINTAQNPTPKYTATITTFKDDSTKNDNLGSNNFFPKLPTLSPQKPADSGSYEVSNPDDPFDGVKVIVVFVEVGVAFLVILLIIWVSCAIRRVNRNAQDRQRRAEDGMEIPPLSPTSYNERFIF